MPSKRNWKQVNESLQKRGDFTFWISEELLTNWSAKPKKKKKRGGQPDYTSEAIRACFSIRMAFRLPYRQTEGFITAIFRAMGLSLSVPDYTTISRRAEKLEVPSVIERFQEGPIELALDSTGLKVGGPGEWFKRKHRAPRRKWKKLHMAIDTGTGEIVNCRLTGLDGGDGAVGTDMLDELIQEHECCPLESVCGDGGYDTADFYEFCAQTATKAKVPPRKNAKIWRHGNKKTPPHPRDENLRKIRRGGLKKWKKELGYHQRNHSETAMHRYKSAFGGMLRSRKPERQQMEVYMGVQILNTFNQFTKVA